MCHENAFSVHVEKQADVVKSPARAGEALQSLCPWWKWEENQSAEHHTSAPEREFMLLLTDEVVLS